jgi:L-lactate dehydrogenase complex protein LldF
MRYWRNEAFAHGLPSGWFNFGLSWWGAFARRPLLYRVVSGLAARVLRLAAGRSTRLSSFPMLHGWFTARDLPKPARTSFQSQWRRTRQ